ncbi:UNVERIFIED_CONTAM: hypothetical protein Sradi_6880800 [Sesamum radiatum]|uniref:Reverse transcriptase zinc-binding domain-containing protein n=1 Tax=Sesamum radiatum TaxID=300843 RepID=A0AAW2JLP1_SESRA
MITDIVHLDIVDRLPPLARADSVGWRKIGGALTTAEGYRLFRTPRQLVGWHGLLRGPLRIPRNCFILWLAILERLSTLDRAWWLGLDSTCILCSTGEVETHSHLFFGCEYSKACLRFLEREVRFRVPRFDWQRTITWASRRWRGKHLWNAAYRALFTSVVYHIWMERNKRRFGNTATTAEHTARICNEQIRILLVGPEMRLNVATSLLFHVWKIPWHAP